ncbi:MAG: hypothetical protein HYT81_04880 [Gemmatimonadetes bacterium]|nr:hypothetical protein [Gemmatimonadota bacterium]
MKHVRMTYAALAVLALGGAAACTDEVGPELSDVEVVQDLALSSGDAIALDLSELVANEAFGGFGGAPALGNHPLDVTVTRSRTCYDQQGNEQAQCDRLTTASMRIQVTMDGTRQREHFTANIHRTRDLVISGLLGEETSRTHDGVGTANDTTTLQRDGYTRTVRESSIDSIVNVVFHLPHATNPWPVSGQIIRNVNATITITGPREETRTISRRVVVTFPPDAQGNVSIQIGSTTCTLNLVTRQVTNCSAA